MSEFTSQELLIVDDEELIREILKDLAGQEGAEAGEASNGAEALEKLRTGEYLCVLTDISMPKMDGLTFLETLRSQGVEIPVVVVTGYGDNEKVKKALRLGATDYIEKPFDEEDVRNVIRRALEVGKRWARIQQTLKEPSEESSEAVKARIQHEQARILQAKVQISKKNAA